ncbi:MAG: hypothetical protein ACJ8G7_23115 [Rhizobacter sp.]
MVALAAAQRAPQRVAALLAAMPQEHERGLGNWQAELAEWPGLFASASGAARALAQAGEGLEVDGARMRRNIEALQGLVFSEDLATFLGPVLGKSEAQARVERWSQQTVAGGGLLREVAAAGIAADPALAAVLHPERLATLFDLDRAAQRAGAFAGPQLEALHVAAAALDAD